MVKTLMKGFSVFAVLLISSALMKLLGEPLIELIPSGTWGLEWLASAVLWLITIDALFWIIAAGVAFLAFVLLRSRLLELLSSVVVGVSVAGGVIGGAAYRLNNLASPVANAATDPALLIL